VAGSGAMTMPGIPTALFMAAVVIVLASSLLMPLLLRHRAFNGDPPTRDLLQNRLIKAAVRARPFYEQALRLGMPADRKLEERF